MSTDLRDKVVRLEAKMEGVENVPARIVELEAGFSHMKSTLEDIRLQGMEQSRIESARYDKITSTMEENHTKVMTRIGGVERKQNIIFNSFNAVVFCGVLLVGGVYLWSKVLSPSLSTRIVHDSRVTNAPTVTALPEPVLSPRLVE